MTHHRGLVAGDGDGGVEGESLCEVAKVADRVDEVLDIILGLSRDLAAVKRLDLSDDELVLLNRVGEAHEEHASFVGGQPRPVGLVECLLCRHDGTLDIVRLHVGYGSQFFAGTGVVGVEGVAVGGKHLLTADHGSVNFLGEKRLHFGEQGLSGYGSRAHGCVMLRANALALPSKVKRRNPEGALDQEHTR